MRRRNLSREYHGVLSVPPLKQDITDIPTGHDRTPEKAAAQWSCPLWPSVETIWEQCLELEIRSHRKRSNRKKWFVSPERLHLMYFQSRFWSILMWNYESVPLSAWIGSPCSSVWIGLNSGLRFTKTSTASMTIVCQIWGTLTRFDLVTAKECHFVKTFATHPWS